MSTTTTLYREPMTSDPPENEEATPPADPEVRAKPRRQFSATYKVKILEEADACKNGREVGALLRREGLYSSHLSTWRKQREEGTLAGLKPKKRGRKAKPADPSAEKVKQLEAENRKLKRRLERVELMLDIQKKASELLGIPLKAPENDESGS
jgi:transposase-like protein